MNWLVGGPLLRWTKIEKKSQNNMVRYFANLVPSMDILGLVSRFVLLINAISHHPDEGELPRSFEPVHQ